MNKLINSKDIILRVESSFSRKYDTCSKECDKCNLRCMFSISFKEITPCGLKMTILKERRIKNDT